MVADVREISEYVSRQQYQDLLERYQAVLNERQNLIAQNNRMKDIIRANPDKQHAYNLEREVRMYREISKTPLQENDKIIIPILQRLHDSPHTRKDPELGTRVCKETVAKYAGISEDTVRRRLLKEREQFGQYIQFTPRKELNESGVMTEYLYIKPIQGENFAEEIAKLRTGEVEKKQGGDRTKCSKCGSAVVIHKIAVCTNPECNHVEELEPVYPLGHPQRGKKAVKVDNCSLQFELTDKNAVVIEGSLQSPKSDLQLANGTDGKKNLDNGLQLAGHLLKPVTPPYSRQVATDHKMLEQCIDLLLSIAGDHDQYICMPHRKGDEKYLTIGSQKAPRMLTRKNIEDHLNGYETYGARLYRKDGSTRALCFDADDLDAWEVLKDAARKLALVGIMAILEESPARGGHLWIIFDSLVNNLQARQYILSLVPELEEINEYWPKFEDTGNRVRLPAGLYYDKHIVYDVDGTELEEIDITAWCTMTSVVDGEISVDNTTHAAFLLSHQTPAGLIPPPEKCTQEKLLEADQVEKKTGKTSKTQEKQPAINAIAPIAPIASDVYHDEISREQYSGKGLWFQWGKPDYVAEWFNANHTLEDILPTDRRGMAFSPNGSERTPSTAYYMPGDKELWTDFSEHGQLENGQHDSGDALELYCRVHNRNKADVLREASRDLLRQARSELEAAATSGRPIPAWIEDIITPDGRSYYAWLLRKNAADGGVHGFIVASDNTDQATIKASPVVPEAPVTVNSVIVAENVADVINNSALAVPIQKTVDDIPTPIQEICGKYRLTVGDACKCGCPVQRDMSGYLVCVRCCPASKRNNPGSEYHLYSDVIDQYYPRKHEVKFGEKK